ncbi:hypothetical protein CBOS2020_27910 [Clostridium botulinum]|nr:hypothetical protein CBOS2020_27910 [Clostridium botulinum]
MLQVARGLYRRWGITPRPEGFILLNFIILIYYSSCFMSIINFYFMFFNSSTKNLHILSTEDILKCSFGV